MPQIRGTTSLKVNTAQAVIKNTYDYWAIVHVNFTNTGSTLANISMAVSTNQQTPNASEWILYNQVLLPNDSYEYRGLTLSSGQYVVVKSTSANVVVGATGIADQNQILTNDIVQQ